MIANFVNDLKGKCTMPCYVSGDRAYVMEAVAERLPAIVKFLGNKEWLAGELTYIDFVFAELLELIAFVSEGSVYNDHPTLKAYRDRFFAIPNIAAYVASETFMAKPFNNTVAKLGSIRDM